MKDASLIAHLDRADLRFVLSILCITTRCIAPKMLMATHSCALTKGGITLVMLIDMKPTEAASYEFKEAQVIAQRYRLSHRLGGGGFGEIYLATHTSLHYQVALKFLRPSYANNLEALQRFKLEGVASCQAKHPNIIEVFDFGFEDGCAFLAMEHLQGETLEEFPRAGLRLGRCCSIFRAIGNAVAWAHKQGVLHRDIKPANIFLHQGPDGVIPKLLDFGLAKIANSEPEETAQTGPGLVIGTAAYLSPERILGLPYGNASDVYSLAIALFESLIGALPLGSHHGDLYDTAQAHLNETPLRLRRWMPEAPEGLEGLLAAALSKNPEERPTAKEFAAWLSFFEHETLPLLGVQKSSAGPTPTL